MARSTLKAETTIHSIELMSTGWMTSGASSAIEQLNDIASKSSSVVGVIAYHTLKAQWPIDKCRNLIDCMTANDSYLCVGWQAPTNFSGIDELSKWGFTFYIDVVRSPSFPKDLDPIFNNLLHSKLLLFEGTDGTSTLVIGSHNWTKSALTGSSTSNGLNVEDSVIIHAGRDHPVIVAAKKRIEEIQSKCLPYNTRDCAAYERLQDSSGGRIMLEVKNNLPKNCEEIILLFSRRADAKKFNVNNRGYIINKSSGVTWRFTSDGSVSTEELEFVLGTRYVSNWAGGSLAVRRLNSGTAVPAHDAFAILALDRLPRKTPFSILKPTTKGMLWRHVEEFHLEMPTDEETNSRSINIQRLLEFPDIDIDTEVEISSIKPGKRYIVKIDDADDDTTMEPSQEG